MSISCNICYRDLSGQYYVDGKTSVGPWGYLCLDCWEEHGVGRFALGMARLYTPAHESIAHQYANDPDFFEACKKGVHLTFSQPPS